MEQDEQLVLEEVGPPEKRARMKPRRFLYLRKDDRVEVRWINGEWKSGEVTQTTPAWTKTGKRFDRVGAATVKMDHGGTLDLEMDQIHDGCVRFAR